MLLAALLKGFRVHRQLQVAQRSLLNDELAEDRKIEGRADDHAGLQRWNTLRLAQVNNLFKQLQALRLLNAISHEDQVCSCLRLSIRRFDCPQKV